MSALADPPNDRFRILCVDGGGMRGLLSVLVIEELESRLEERLGRAARISDYFHLLSGTSTGGLISLALTAPEAPSLEELTSFYTADGPTIFHRSLFRKLRTLFGLIGPKYSLKPLRAAVEARLGTARLSEALRDVLITSYDMTNREPYFFKRWRALQSEDADAPIADAALATSAAPTYFPCHDLHGCALVDGGVFAANPAIAAIAEALGRNSDPPAKLSPADLLVVSIGTGRFETGYSPGQVGGWGALGWVFGGGGDHPVLSAMLGGSSDGSDYWAHMLLNHAPGDARPGPDEVGRGPRYFRLQAPLHEMIEMDDPSPETIDQLRSAAAELIGKHDAELDQIAERLASLEPLS